MLMGNAAKILQTVAANIDNDVIEPVITELYDMIMLTDTTGMLRGDENIEVLGVNVAIQRETQRQRQLEFLQITANPIDMQIIGPRGRAEVLRSVSDGIGLQGSQIVPSDEEIQASAGCWPPPARPSCSCRSRRSGGGESARRVLAVTSCSPSTTSPCDVRDRPAALVEGNLRDRDALVTDRAQHQAALERLSLAGRPRGKRAVVTGSRRLRSTTMRSTRSSPCSSTGEVRNRSTMRFGFPVGALRVLAQDPHVLA